MNCIDLFAGAGGLSEGFYKCGFNMIAHVEKEYHACLTLQTRLAYHYLNSINKFEIYKDYINGIITREEFYSNIPNSTLNSVINKAISEDTLNEIFENVDNLVDNKKVDIIIGGPPCQAYSLVGRARDPKSMKRDKRKYLYRYYIKFLERYQPKLFVFENVKGMLSANKGRLFKQICKEMKDVGYEVKYKILDAADFGIAQNRKRVIIIGWKTELGLEYPDFEAIPSKYSINDLFEDLPKLKSNTIGTGKKYRKIDNQYATEMNLKSKNLETVIQHDARRHNERDLKIYKIAVKKYNQGVRLKYTDLPEELITHNNLNAFTDRFKVVSGNGFCHTMVAHIAKDGHHYIHPDIKQNRSITVREAARIQSFPDDYYFETCRTSAYTQIGNAVPPLMAQKIAQKIITML